MLVDLLLNTPCEVFEEYITPLILDVEEQTEDMRQMKTTTTIPVSFDILTICALS